MLDCEKFSLLLNKNGFSFFTGVPDSTLKNWLDFISDKDNHGLTNRIAAIERDAIGLAAGYYVATRKIPVVYMQNSGLGNTVNPMTSLADPKVFSIPMLLFVGWRGENGQNDEPEHLKMGEITTDLLDVLGVKWKVLPDNIEGAKSVILEAKEYLRKKKGSYGIVIRKNTFAEYKKQKDTEANYELKREEAVQIIAASLAKDDLIVSTTGKISRELFEYREKMKSGHKNDFLMVGSMGLAVSFGAEVALQRTDKRVFIFDGDGALLMSAGALSTVGYCAPKNLYHIVFDNESYESTGGQPTVSSKIDFQKLALANNYKGAKKIISRKYLNREIKKMTDQIGPQMLVIKITGGSRKNLGRPIISPAENKEIFMRFLG